MHQETDEFGVGVFGQIQPEETAVIESQAMQATDRLPATEPLFQRRQHGLLNGPRRESRNTDLDQQGRLSRGDLTTGEREQQRDGTHGFSIC